MLQVKVLVVGRMATNCYLIFDSSRKALILDPGDDAEYILNEVLKNRLKPVCIIATHGHFDHLLAIFALQSTLEIPFYIHKPDKFLLNRMSLSAKYFLGIRSDPPAKASCLFKNGQRFKIGNEFVTVVFTPGHTPGSISLVSEKNKFIWVGDLVFAGGYLGRTDYGYSSKKMLLKSVKRILDKYKSYRIFPGHGKSFLIANNSTSCIVVEKKL